MSAGNCQLQLFARSAGGGVSWRLLSGNNRELGRGALAHPDITAAINDVVYLQQRAAVLRIRPYRVDAHRWSWEARLGGTPVATAGHTFDRMIRCERAIEQFLAEFAGAPVRSGLVLSGARRWDRAS